MDWFDIEGFQEAVAWAYRFDRGELENLVSRWLTEAKHEATDALGVWAVIDDLVRQERSGSGFRITLEALAGHLSTILREWDLLSGNRSDTWTGQLDTKARPGDTELPRLDRYVACEQVRAIHIAATRREFFVRWRNENWFGTGHTVARELAIAVQWQLLDLMHEAGWVEKKEVPFGDDPPDPAKVAILQQIADTSPGPGTVARLKRQIDLEWTLGIATFASLDLPRMFPEFRLRDAACASESTELLRSESTSNSPSHLDRKVELLLLAIAHLESIGQKATRLCLSATLQEDDFAEWSGSPEGPHKAAVEKGWIKPGDPSPAGNGSTLTDSGREVVRQLKGNRNQL